MPTSTPGSAPAPVRSLRGLSLGEDGDPPVLVMFDYTYDRTLQTPGFWERLAERPVLIALLRSWEIRDAKNLAGWPEKIAAHRRAHPAHDFVTLANAPGELDVLREAGMEAIYCSHNAFVDEALYRPDDGAKAGDAREFDAIYDARVVRFKRHQLAVRVPRLALVHYDIPHGRQPWWMRWVRLRLWRAKFLNKHRGLWPRWMSRPEVAACYRRARVGLCLSEAEGAMLASIQYLLTGLPVVTTPSRGGRDVFFDADNSSTVEPDARAVAAAVLELIGRRVDPWAIRARALERVAEHRERFRARVTEYQAARGVPPERRLGADWGRRAGELFTESLT